MRLDSAIDNAPAMAERFDEALELCQVCRFLHSARLPSCYFQSCFFQGHLEAYQDESDVQFYDQLSKQLHDDFSQYKMRIDMQTDLRQGVDDDSESLAAELRLMEEFFFQGLPFPQGRRFFCPVTDCSTHLVMGFSCVDSLCSHMLSSHQMTLKDLEARCGWSSVILTQNLPVQSAQTFSEPNAALFQNTKNRSAFVNAPAKVAVGFVAERKHHSLQALLSQLTSQKTILQDRVDAHTTAIQQRETQKSREMSARRLVIGELLPKLDSAISRLKSETGSKLTQAILDIGNLAFHGPQVRTEIMLANVLPVISALLQSRSEAHREHAASAIKNLCLDLEHQRAVRKAGCIPHLVALLKGTRMQRKETLCALVNLVRGDPGSVGNVKNQRAVVDAGGLEEIRQINQTANDGVRQLTESVLAWMDTFDPNAADGSSSSESESHDFKADSDIQTDKASINSLGRCIVETNEALAKMNNFRAALPSMQIAHKIQPQPQIQQSAASFQPRAPSSYSHASSSFEFSRPAGYLDQARRLGVRSATITQKYFTHIGNLDYTCNTCGATVRDGTRDYHLKRYHPEMVQRMREDVQNAGSNPEHEGEKKISVLSVVYENLGDLNFRCKLCDKIVRDGSRDYHIKTHHGDRMEELKEQKRQLLAERRTSDLARRFPEVSSPSTPAIVTQEFSAQQSVVSSSLSSASHDVKVAEIKPSSSKSHKKAEPLSEPREPLEPKAPTLLQIEEIKKKGVSLRENEKLRASLIERVAAFVDMDVCQAFRDDEGDLNAEFVINLFHRVSLRSVPQAHRAMPRASNVIGFVESSYCQGELQEHKRGEFFRYFFS